MNEFNEKFGAKDDNTEEMTLLILGKRYELQLCIRSTNNWI